MKNLVAALAIVFCAFFSSAAYPQAIAIGSSVTTNGSAPVLSRPNNGKITCVQPAGAAGTVTAGPQSWRNVAYWNVTFVSSCSGWVNQTQLTVVSGGGGAVLPPPTTHNYATGCNGGSCLRMDDHWITASLDTTKWYPGLYVNNNYIFGETNGGAFCYAGGDPNPNAPFSAWTMGDVASPANNSNFGFGYPYAAATDPTAGFYTAGAAPYLSIDPTDGSLKFQLVTNSYWYNRIPSGCNFSVPVTVGGPYITSAVAIPRTGGALQFRMKTDTGLNYGEWPGLQCSANDGGVHNGTDQYNISLEWGWNWIGSDPNITAMNSLEAAQANVALSPVGQSNTLYRLPNNSDWATYHTVLMEYEGDNAAQSGTWNIYVDGNLAYANTPAISGGVDYYCAIYNNMTPHSYSARPRPSTTNPPPFHFNISDWQIWQKP